MDFISKLQSPGANVSAFTVPAMFLITQSAHLYAVVLTKGKFTNASPREFVSSLQRKEKKEPWERKFLRAEGAQQNGFESLGFFAAAVALANYANVPTPELNRLSVGYLITRILFNFIYINVESESASPMRSLVWLSSMIINTMLFFKAGYRLNGWA